MTKWIIVIIVGSIFAWAAGFNFTEILIKGKQDINRGHAYFLCVLLVFVCAIGIGLVVSASVEPGDEMEWSGQVATEYRPGKSLAERDQIIERIFLITIVPALIGVRHALGPKPNRSSPPA